MNQVILGDRTTRLSKDAEQFLVDPFLCDKYLVEVFKYWQQGSRLWHLTKASLGSKCEGRPMARRSRDRRIKFRKTWNKRHSNRILIFALGHHEWPKSQKWQIEVTRSSEYRSAHMRRSYVSRRFRRIYDVREQSIRWPGRRQSFKVHHWRKW